MSETGYNENHHCTLEQAVTLFELGLKQSKKYPMDECFVAAPPSVGYETFIKRWSTGELLDILPWSVYRDNERYVLIIDKSPDLAFPEDPDTCEWYLTYENDRNNSDIYGIFRKSLAQAAAATIIYLLENKYMTL